MRQPLLPLLLQALLLICVTCLADGEETDFTPALSRRIIHSETNKQSSNNDTSKKKARGIFDDMASGLNSLMSFATGNAGAPVDTGEGGLNLVPNHCWYR